MAKNPKPVRLRKRVNARDRRQRYWRRIHKFRVGDMVCACGGHKIIAKIDDGEIDYEGGGGCSIWHCGVFKVKDRYKDKSWCNYCGIVTKDEIIQSAQNWFIPGEKGTDWYYQKLNKDSTYADKRSFYLFCLRYSHKAEPWIRKSLQRDLARIRKGRIKND